ncbi:MAG: LysR family transcriptional regulator [Alphaproteobacteria bacterium]
MSAQRLSGQLRYRALSAFRVVYETCSVTRAAEHLDVTQPAISQILAAFEAALGFRLFARGPGRRLVPTGEARALYGEVCRAVDALDRLAAAITTIGRLSVAAGTSGAEEGSRLPEARRAAGSRA